MIYKCTESHRELVLDFLSTDPILNLFVIGDIETYGFDSLDQDVWAYTDEEEQITGVLLRYKENAIPVHGTQFTGFETFLPLLQSLEEVRVISGEKSTIDQYIDYFHDLEATETDLSICSELTTEADAIYSVEKLKKEDISSYLTLQKACFKKESESEMTLSDMLNNETVLIHVIKNESGEIVSAGRLAVESAAAGMIIGVGTVETERGKGYASAVVASLAQVCLAKGKKACLFYHDPKAGSLYHRLGFQDTGEVWSMLKPKEEKAKKSFFEELATE